MGMSYGHCSKCHRVLEDTNGVCLIGYFLIDGKPVCKECCWWYPSKFEVGK